MTAILTVSKLRKSFGSVVAAHQIDCEIQPGEVVGIIGSNGAGKTTFVNMITGHLVPTSGHIAFEGRDITGMPSRRLVGRGLSRSFQIAQIFPLMTVLENLCAAVAVARHRGGLLSSTFSRLSAPAHRKEAQRLMEAFRIAAHADCVAGTLAQGVRKVLDIAMACASEPRLMMLDEPTSGVAMDERDALMQSVTDALRRFGTTIIFIEHDMDIVRRYAGRVMAFYDGRVIGDGPPDAVLTRQDVQNHIIGIRKEVST